MRPRVIRRVTARATAVSSMGRTALGWICCNLCRWKIPSKFHGSRCAMIRIACVAFPSRPMPNGCWAARAAQPRPTSSRKSSRSRRPSSRAAPGAANSAAVSRLPILRGQQTSFTGDRTEFFGRNGTAERPAALERGGPLSGKIGPALDPCAALQTTIELRPGARAEVVFFLGQAENREQARDLLMRYRTADLDKVFGEVTRRWDDILDTVQSRHPRSQHGCDAESLAALSNTFLPRVGPRRVFTS